MSKEPKKYPPEAIANNILWLAKENGVKITPMQLIKLVYIVYGWSLALMNDRKVFDDPIEAWQHGPVIPRLYYQFSIFGGKPIDTFAVTPDLNDNGVVVDNNYPVVDEDDNDLLSVVAAVWNTYKKRDGWSLRGLTHKENSPWSKAFAKGKYTRLDDEDIKKRSIEGINKSLRENKKQHG